MSYYFGNLEADLARLENEKYVPDLELIGRTIGYGRAQQILQVLWAKRLREEDYPTVGALLPDPIKPEGL